MSIQNIAVVTGGNKGIGFAIVKELCEKFDGIVYLTARDESRGKTAVQELNKHGLNPAFHVLDIDYEESIKKFKDYIVEKHGALRPGARVVNLSSVCGHLSKINGKEPYATKIRGRFSNPDLTEKELCQLMEEFVKAAKDGDHYAMGWPNSAYVVSKVGVSALTRIQQRAFDADTSRPGIVVNAVHPGYVDTDMTSHKGPLTTEEGAVAPTYLALLPSNNDVPKGAFVWKDKTVVSWKKDLPSGYTF
ncbi:hypothetical protein J437_LFUL003282 [Ladona fulva]|uniref:Carbonyl reductase n=1 Tax=Ladona fulva TaxID=123851 RepID=A0A8K0P6A4_LADFU|nr:hypothetical protein J437_LFUL003282 [Ladona fulva]